MKALFNASVSQKWRIVQEQRALRHEKKTIVG
jgi:hypothetical protein